jgi:hypothetical protein
MSTNKNKNRNKNRNTNNTNNSNNTRVQNTKTVAVHQDPNDDGNIIIQPETTIAAAANRNPSRPQHTKKQAVTVPARQPVANGKPNNHGKINTAKATAVAASTPADSKAVITTTEVPAFITTDEKKLAAWKDAEDGVKDAAISLYNLVKSSSRSEIIRYYDFYDEWTKTYPQNDKARYAYGESYLRRGAILAGVSERFVYALLSTIRLYSREGYLALENKANAHGVYLSWTTLRIIAEKLGAKEYKAARSQVEAEIVKRKYTENELKELIHRIVPELAEAQADSRQQTSAINDGRNSASQIQQLIICLDKTTHIATNWENVLTAFLDATPADNQKAILGAREMFKQLVEHMDAVQVFFDDNYQYLRDILQEFEILGNNASQTTEEIQTAAENVRKQLTEQYNTEQQNKSRKQKEAVLNNAVDWQETDIEDNGDDGPVMEFAPEAFFTENDDFGTLPELDDIG